ncbi:MAG: hypothetical protein OXD44_11535 [Gammaproteobacteria bacterium]|nr:hypothetical protein [Gammaproteobacteria bacterium]
MDVNEDIRKDLAMLARRRKARRTEFTVERPCDWRPSQVRNPNGLLDEYFTNEAAWELIASKLEENHPVEVVELQKPKGKKGYVMVVNLEPGKPPLYVKLQQGSGVIYGRSFHYSKERNRKSKK